MREVISVHVGQAGVQIGNACCKSLVFNKRSAYIRYHEKRERRRVVLLFPSVYRD